MSTEQQIAALAAAMSTLPQMGGPRLSIPPPARMMWARELVEKWGVSIDPDKATLEAVSDSPTQLGHHGPQTVRERKPLSQTAQHNLVAGARDYINTNFPDLAERIAAADTPAKQAALREELRREIPGPIQAAMTQLEQTDPEDLACEDVP